MGEITEIFHEILILAKDGMNIRDEGLSIEEYSSSLLAAENILGELKTALKNGNVSLNVQKDSIGQSINEHRRNPNKSLEEFKDDPPKSCNLDDNSEEQI